MEENNVARVMTASGLWTEKTCFMCGKHFLTGDSIVLVLPPYEYKKKYKRLINNAVMHQHEWEELKQTHDSFDDIFNTMGSSKKPKKVELTPQQKEMVEQFIQAAWNYGYKDYKYTKDGAQSKMNGSSDILRYNVHSDRIAYSNRRKRGLFDGLANRQVVTNVWNRMHELRGDGKRDDFSAKEVVNQAMDKVSDIFGK